MDGYAKRRLRNKPELDQWKRYRAQKYSARSPSSATKNIPHSTKVESNCKGCKKYTLVLLTIQFSHSVVSDSLRPCESQHARPPCPSPTPRVHPNSCPLSRWCHPTISSSVVPFISCLQSFPASGSFQMSQLFTSGGQSIGVSASTSVLPVKNKDWSLLGGTGWKSLQSQRL